MTNLDYEASMENNTFSIAISWNPIPSTIDRMPLFPRISNITYNVTVIDNFNNIVYSSESVNDTRVVFTLGNPSPCYYYNVSVISIINAKYSGTEVIRGKIYLYQGMDSLQ